MQNENATGLPGHASVVVIGGGVMGCSTLYHLATQGVNDVILLERHKLTSGTTWHSAAQVRALRSTRNLTDLIKYSISLYSSLESETGQGTGWINKGSLSIATHPDRLTHIRRQESLAHLFGIQAQSISPGEAAERWPLMYAGDVLGAVWSPDDGRVSPSDLCASLIKAARNKGAKIFEDTAVIGLLTKQGRIWGVETAAGQIKCDAVALCTGLWSKREAASAGVDVPVWPCEHFYLLTKPVPGIEGNLPTLSDHDAHLYIRDDSGGLLVGCFEPMGKAIDPDRLGNGFSFQLLEEDWDHFEPMMKNAMHRLPVLAQAEVRMLLNGPESFTPDGSFLLGEAAETAGLFLGCGMNSVGVASAGGAGLALARCIAEGHFPMDLHELDPKRFPECFSSAGALANRVPEVLGKHYEITYPGRQWRTARNLRLTPLHQRWVDRRAYFGQYYGWERPLYFGSDHPPVFTFERPVWFEQVEREVMAAHEGAALFDLSTFGNIRVSGPDAESFLNRICANNMTRAPGSVIYTAMLNDRGGFVSDLTAQRLSAEEYLLFVGTSTVKHDLAWLSRNLREGECVTICDDTEKLATLGLMGPHSNNLMVSVDGDKLSALRYFQHQEFELKGIQVRAARLSYVGEYGWELTCSVEKVNALYDLLAGAGAQPAGIFAQTSMRIEKGYLSYGHDLDTDINPFEAGLDYALDWDSAFIGSEALAASRQAAITKRRVSIILDYREANPIGNEPVYYDGEIIGQTTSAAYGYRVGHPVAIAYLNTGSIKNFDNLTVQIDVAGTLFTGKVVVGAVFDPSGAQYLNPKISSN